MENLKMYKCIDGRCPVGIDLVKKIGLTPEEKRAIFFTLKQEIFKLKKIQVDVDSQETLYQ